MTAAEWGVLLLCCALPGEEKPLSLPQFQELGRRARALGCRGDDPLRELTARDLARLGYDAAQSTRITRLLAREAQLEQYLRAAAAQGITAVTRLSSQYPARLRHTLGPRCPAVLFAKGEAELLSARCISVVGSRELSGEGRAFAAEAGRRIAAEGFALCSGGAMGADRAAQEALRSAGYSALLASVLAARGVVTPEEAAEKLDGYVSSEKGYSLDVDGTEAVLLEPSNGSDFQSCAALTTLPDPVWAYIQFKVNKVGSISVRKVDAAGEALAGAEFLLETSADGQSWTEVGSVTTGADGLAQWENLKTGVQYRITEAKAPVGYTLLPEPVEVGMLTADAADITITLCNNAGFELPFTGGTGFTTYFLLAALMLCMGVYFCKKSNIRKENN